MRNLTMTSLMDGPLHQNIFCEHIIQIIKLPLFRGETKFWDLSFEHNVSSAWPPSLYVTPVKEQVIHLTHLN